MKKMYIQIVTNVLLCWSIEKMEKDMHALGQRVYEKSLYFTLNFAMNLTVH